MFCVTAPGSDRDHGQGIHMLLWKLNGYLNTVTAPLSLCYPVGQWEGPLPESS